MPLKTSDIIKIRIQVLIEASSLKRHFTAVMAIALNRNGYGFTAFRAPACSAANRSKCPFRLNHPQNARPAAVLRLTLSGKDIFWVPPG